MKIRKLLIVFSFLALLLISCVDNSTTYTLEKTDKFYIYSIGKGETIRVGRNDDDHEQYLIDLNNEALYKNNTINSVTLSNGELLSSDSPISVNKGKNLLDLSISCIDEFEGEITISYVKFYYEEDNVYLNMKYNITLTYNEDFINCFSFAYENNVNEKNKNCYLYNFSNDSTFYLMLRFHDLGFEKNSSFVIKSFESANSNIIVSNKKYGPNMPYKKTEGTLSYMPFTEYYNTVDYQDFEEVDIKDYCDYYDYDGIIIKFDLTANGEFDSVGCDIIFSCVINGDEHNIPLHARIDKEHIIL